MRFAGMIFVYNICIFRSWYIKWNNLIWWLRNYDAGFSFDLHRKYTKEIFCAQFDVAVKRRMEWIENHTIMCNLHYSLFLYFPHHVYRYLSWDGPLARYAKLRVRMRRECRERFPRHRR